MGYVRRHWVLFLCRSRGGGRTSTELEKHSGVLPEAQSIKGLELKLVRLSRVLAEPAKLAGANEEMNAVLQHR